MNNKSPCLVFFLVVVLLGVICTAYHNLEQCEFIGFDDDLYVSDNRYVRQGLTPASVKWAFTAAHASTWQPLVWLTYMAESHLQGHNITPGLFHKTNLFLHLLNTALLFTALFLMTGAPWPSLLVAGLFGLHPVHTESVAWVAERKDVLSTLFWMLTIIFYCLYTRKASIVRYLLFAGAFIIGLMAKPMLVTIPFVLLLVDYWPLERAQRGWKYLVLEKSPLLLPMLASTVITIYVQKKGGSVASLEHIPLLARLGNIPVFYAQYLMKIFWPRPLAILYPHPGTSPLWKVLTALVLLAAITLLINRSRKKYPFLQAGWLWFLVTLLPVIGLVQIGLHGIADRFLYVPAIGIYMMLAWFVTPKAKYFFFGASVCVLLLLAYMTHRQVSLWRDNITVFSHAAKVTDDNWAMINCLGAARERSGDLDGALQEFRKAAKINPMRPRIHYNLGCALQKKGDLQGAIDAYRRALEIAPGYTKVRYNLACAFEIQKSYDDALEAYRMVLESEPGHLMSMNNIGTVYTKQGKLEQALEAYRKALAVAPGYTNARFNLGAVLFQLNRYEEAESQFREILAREPGNGAARKSLALVLRKSGKREAKSPEQ